jgi:serine/threonine protein kinase
MSSSMPKCLGTLRISRRRSLTLTLNSNPYSNPNPYPNPNPCPSNPKNGNIKVKFPTKFAVSKNAKDLILGLLSYNKASRLTVEDALSHAWFGGSSGTSSSSGQQPSSTASSGAKRARSAVGPKVSPSKKKRVEEDVSMS